jgi:hypothetical protein
VAPEDRAASVPGVERAVRAEGVGRDVDVAAQRDHARVDGHLERGRPGAEVEAGGGDAVALDATPGWAVGGRDPAAGPARAAGT